MSDSLQPHGLQHAGPPCPLLSPGVCPSSWLFNQWYHSTISSSVVPFFSFLQSFPASRSFPLNQSFTSGGQSIGASAPASVLPVTIQPYLWPNYCTIHLYMTTGKTIALTRWTFVNKVMPLLFNTLSGFLIAFLPRSNRCLISWVQSWSAVILEPKKRKFVTASTFSSYICHELMGQDAMILALLILSSKLFFPQLLLTSRGRIWLFTQT